MNQLPVGWVRSTVGAVLPVRYGKAAPRTNDGDIPVVASAGPIRHTTQELAPGPTLVVGRKGGVGRVQLFDGPTWPTDTTYFISVPEALSAEFLYYQMSALGLERLDRSTAVPSLQRQDLESAFICLPPRQEQERIVAAIEEQFSRLEVGVTALERVKHNLNRMRTALLQCAIDGRLIGEDGSSWDLIPLTELGSLDRGKSRHRPRNDPSLYGGPYPFIQTGDVALADPWITLSTQTYNDKGLAQSRLWPKGTLCITIAANIAKTGLLTFDACFPDSVVGFTAAGGESGARWVELVVRSMRDRLDQLAPATAQKNINLAILRSLHIPYPDSDCRVTVVREYDRQMSLINVLEEAIMTSMRRAIRLRTSILGSAFAGKLATQNPYDEPASALLDRITSHRLVSSGH